MHDCWCWWLCAVRAQMGSSLSQLRETQPPLFSGSKASRISASNRGDSDRKVIGWNVKWPPILRFWFRLCVICVHCSPWVLKHIQISKEIILVTNMCVFPLAKQLFTFCYHHTFKDFTYKHIHILHSDLFFDLHNPTFSPFSIVR